MAWTLKIPSAVVPFVEGPSPTDWKYDMRREMQEIIPGLFLGPYSVAVKTKLDYLLNHRITHIVCIRHKLEVHFIRPNFPDTFRYLVLEIADTLSENIIPHFSKVNDFLDVCFSEGGRALVHGNTGISRSATLVMAYIMQRFELAYREAMGVVQRRRFCAVPNERFTQQLKEYEPIYRAERAKAEKSLEGGHLKRSFEESENEEKLLV